MVKSSVKCKKYELLSITIPFICSNVHNRCENENEKNHRIGEYGGKRSRVDM